MRNPLLRVFFSAALVVIVCYLVYSRSVYSHGRSDKLGTWLFGRKSGGSTSFLSTAPSSEGSKRFAWIPQVPGAQIEGIRTNQTRERLSYGFRFKVAEDPNQILTFYETHLRAGGFTVLVNNSDKDGSRLHAENPDRTRLFDVTAATISGGSEMIVEAIERSD